MRIKSTLLLAGTMLFWTVPSAMALRWECPEIDGPAGISALAVLASIAVMTYERLKR